MELSHIQFGLTILTALGVGGILLKLIKELREAFMASAKAAKETDDVLGCVEGVIKDLEDGKIDDMPGLIRTFKEIREMVAAYKKGAKEWKDVIDAMTKAFDKLRK